MEPKYIGEAHETTDGFWYDITDGGYLKPEEMLLDQDRAYKLKQAIQLLEDWKDELLEDEMLIEH